MATLTNQDFINEILNSFKEFINRGTSRSTAKLKPLHGAVAEDVATRLGTNYEVWSQGYGADKEKKINGRYIEKAVDITIVDKESKKPVTGIGIKFVMQNYSQNSNNYFENMLGETANIRAAGCPYSQIFIILDRLPYYNREGVLAKWEEFTDHNMSKYSALSNDNINTFYHTPNKTLIYVVHIDPIVNDRTSTKTEYMDFYTKNKDVLTISISTHQYKEVMVDGTVIMNDYEKFIEKVYHTIKSI